MARLTLLYLILGLSSPGFAQHSTAIFEQGQLKIPSIRVGDEYYYDIRFKLTEGLDFRINAIERGVLLENPTAYYDDQDNKIVIESLSYEGRPYRNAIFEVISGDSIRFLSTESSFAENASLIKIPSVATPRAENPALTLQMVAAVDLNQDGLKDIVGHLWHNNWNAGEDFYGQVPNSLVIFLQSEERTFYFANDIYGFVSEPLRAFLPEGATMIATEVASPFLTPFKLTLVLAIFIAIPFILHQVWSFIAPGLYKNEKRVAFPLLVSSILLFYAGIAFAFYVVFPLIFGFFTSVAPAGVTVMTDINRYLDFVLKLFFAFGIAFEIPIATILLVWTGATDIESLRRKRAYVVVGCFVVGMLLTPPDIISQILLALPMWLLYEIGILFSIFLVRPESDTDAS